MASGATAERTEGEKGRKITGNKLWVGPVPKCERRRPFQYPVPTSMLNCGVTCCIVTMHVQIVTSHVELFPWWVMCHLTSWIVTLHVDYCSFAARRCHLGYWIVPLPGELSSCMLHYKLEMYELWSLFNFVKWNVALSTRMFNRYHECWNIKSYVTLQTRMFKCKLEFWWRYTCNTILNQLQLQVDKHATCAPYILTRAQFLACTCSFCVNYRDIQQYTIADCSACSIPFFYRIFFCERKFYNVVPILSATHCVRAHV